MDDQIINRVREALLEERVRLTDHALEEIEADGLHLIDLESAILTGQVKRMEPEDAQNKGPRYTVVGEGADLISIVAVVCRFERSGQLIIITCYQVNP